MNSASTTTNQASPLPSPPSVITKSSTESAAKAKQQLPQVPSRQQSPPQQGESIDTTVNDELFTKEVNTIALEYLINECVPLSIRVEKMLAKEQTQISGLLKSLKIDYTKKHDNETEGDEKKKDESNNDLEPALDTIDGFEPGRVSFMNEESHYNSLNNLYRIENYGFEIGFKITDCLMYMKNTSEAASANMKLMEVLEIMKFICRDVWKIFYLKQMDNLRTNHIGTFVLVDNSFRPLVNFYSPLGEQDTLKKVQPYLQFSCGLIRGILASLGIESVVKAEVIGGKLPSVSFNVQTDFNNGGLSQAM